MTRPAPLVSTAAERRASFATDGYLRVDRLLDPVDLAPAMALLDPLFDRFASLPGRLGHDLADATTDADAGSAPARVRVPEIELTSKLEPRLLQTEVFLAARAVARTLLGPRAHLVFDHAIYKPAGPSAATRWHQDSSYAKPGDTGLAVWVPMQAVDRSNGCMQFVPGSQLSGPRPHHTVETTGGKKVSYLDWDERDTVAVPLEAGGATVHDINTIHGTGPNLSDGVRRAWILNFAAPSPVRYGVLQLRRTVGSVVGHRPFEI